MKKSAGILLYKKQKGEVLFMLVHPGGPYWAKKDPGSWSLPKGEFEETEDPLKAAIREFREETGKLLTGDFIKLNPVKQNSSKVIYPWALEKDFDTDNIKSNLFEMEWPPRSGKLQSFPEIDKARWFTKDEAMIKIIPGQQQILNELITILANQKDSGR